MIFAATHSQILVQGYFGVGHIGEPSRSGEIEILQAVCSIHFPTCCCNPSWFEMKTGKKTTKPWWLVIGFVIIYSYAYTAGPFPIKIP